MIFTPQLKDENTHFLNSPSSFWVIVMISPFLNFSWKWDVSEDYCWSNPYLATCNFHLIVVGAFELEDRAHQHRVPHFDWQLVGSNNNTVSHIWESEMGEQFELKGRKMAALGWMKIVRVAEVCWPVFPRFCQTAAQSQLSSRQGQLSLNRRDGQHSCIVFPCKDVYNKLMQKKWVEFYEMSRNAQVGV